MTGRLAGKGQASGTMRQGSRAGEQRAANADQYAVILVYSTSYALRAEKVLHEAGIPCKLIPVPRQLSSDCGVCVRIQRAHQEIARQALQAGRVEIDSIQEL
ncbi:MAG: hypothetical protein Kow0063_27880 [Anaerolineae bacterium]